MTEQLLYVIGLGSREDWDAGRGSLYWIEDPNREHALPVFTTREKAERYWAANSDAGDRLDMAENAGLPVTHQGPLLQNRFVVMAMWPETLALAAEQVDAYYPDAASEARQQFSQDLADMPAEEVAESYELALQLLEGYVVASEAFDQPVYMVFADARERTRQAHLIAKGARNEHVDVHEITEEDSEASIEHEMMDETAPSEATAKRSLREVNINLTRALEALEDVPKEAFAGEAEEDLYSLMELIARAGQIVAAEELRQASLA
jgi:hypothetical protein